MAEDAELSHVVEQWLAKGRRFRLGFPAALEARFETDTRAGRSRSMAISSGIGVLIGLLLYPALREALPDVARLSRIYFLESLLPAGVVVTFLLWLDLKPFYRELTQCLGLVATSLCVTSLYVLSRAASTPTYVAAVMLIIAHGAVGAHLRFAFALVLIVLTLGGFYFGLDGMPAITATMRHQLLVMTIAYSVYLLLGNVRHENALRRSYLFALQERFRRLDLLTQNRELGDLARRDALTGLANRRAHDAWLCDAWRDASLNGDHVGLIIIDVDRFKDYNDFYGHPMGDACLQAIGRCLREQARGTTDLVARVGGEEFCILLPGLPVETCSDIAERLRVAVEDLQLPHLGIGARGMVTISAGVSSLVADTRHTIASLFAVTDAALYQAKETGRNRVCLGAADSDREQFRVPLALP